MTKEPAKFIRAYVKSVDRIIERMLRNYCHPEIIEAYSRMNAKLLKCIMDNMDRVSLEVFVDINLSLNESESQLFRNALNIATQIKKG